jgi:hypothetical protein
MSLKVFLFFFCGTAKSFIQFQGFYGSLACPEYEKVCKSPPCKKNCYGGLCVNGKCLNGGDQDGFKGESYPDGKDFPCYSNCYGPFGGDNSSEESSSDINFASSENETSSFLVMLTVLISLLFIT